MAKLDVVQLLNIHFFFLQVKSLQAITVRGKIQGQPGQPEGVVSVKLMSDQFLAPGARALQWRLERSVSMSFFLLTLFLSHHSWPTEMNSGPALMRQAAAARCSPPQAPPSRDASPARSSRASSLRLRACRWRRRTRAAARR